MRIIKTILWNETKEFGGINNQHTELFGSLFFTVISLALTIMNIIKGYSQMAVATSVLVVGFGVAYFLALKRRSVGSRALMAILCAALFTYFAISGGNEGFAILWILLVPVVGFMLLGLKLGFFLSIYFLLLIVALFYTPMSVYVEDYYTDVFIMRFPILYFADFGATLILMCQRQDLYIQVKKQIHNDSLTNLRNRRYYSDLCKELDKSHIDPNLIVFSMDLNALKETNDTLGHDAGDEIIREAGRLVLEAFPGDECCRTGGDEFIVISTREDALKSVDTLKASIAQWHGKLVEKMNISIGYASHADYPDMTLEDLSRMADQNMYIDKSNYYSTIGIDRRKR